ncbi:hypothetical protein C8Q77DRAFT_1154864 [Trametes polyzona]|nr:hypothetical protein C8Q77DRAFT_1154864 [Trametes polyzona]
MPATPTEALFTSDDLQPPKPDNIGLIFGIVFGGLGLCIIGVIINAIMRRTNGDSSSETQRRRNRGGMMLMMNATNS